MAKKTHSLIVFCGVDGSGKSTLIEHLVAHFKKRKVKHTAIHAHGYSVSENSLGIDESTIEKLRYLFMLLLPLAFLDNLYTYFFKYVPLLKRTSVICDRYFYDKLARLMFYGICPKWIAKFYLYLLPKPSHTFILLAPPKEIAARKSEHTIEELQRYYENYRFIAKYLGITPIYTDDKVEITRKVIMRQLFARS